MKSSFGIALNANDFFGYACADMVIVQPEDLCWVIPIYRKHGNSGLYAAMSHISQQKPILPYIDDGFKAALKDIEELNPIVFSEH